MSKDKNKPVKLTKKEIRFLKSTRVIPKYVLDVIENYSYDLAAAYTDRGIQRNIFDRCGRVNRKSLSMYLELLELIRVRYHTFRSLYFDLVGFDLPHIFYNLYLLHTDPEGYTMKLLHDYVGTTKIHYY